MLSRERATKKGGSYRGAQTSGAWRPVGVLSVSEPQPHSNCGIEGASPHRSEGVDSFVPTGTTG